MKATSPYSAVILTLNEMRNIEACIQSLHQFVREIVVVDSGSTDGTIDAAKRWGARVVHHDFVTHAEQWQFALALPLEGSWVIALDADQRVSPELASSLLMLAARVPAGVEGIYVNRLHVFRGQPMRNGGLFPKWMLKVFRRGQGFTDPRELLDFRFYVDGQTVKAQGLLVEDNRNEADISWWIDKHNRFSTRQASEEARRAGEPGGWAVRPSLTGTPDQKVLWLKSAWYKMPLFTRPFLYFAWRYIFRLGFLDGKQGLIFHVLQAFWYRFLVDVKLDEMRRNRQ